MILASSWKSLGINAYNIVNNHVYSVTIKFYAALAQMDTFWNQKTYNKWRDKTHQNKSWLKEKSMEVVNLAIKIVNSVFSILYIVQNVDRTIFC